MRNLPNFRDADDPSRGAPYGWDYGHGASRSRRTFQTKKEKVVFKKEFERRFYSERNALINFDPEEWRDYEREKKRLDGVPISRAVEFYLKHATGKKSVLFSEALKDRLDDITRTGGASGVHAEKYCIRFMDWAGDAPLATYSRNDVQKWIDHLIEGGDFSRQTIANHLSHVNTVFNQAVLKGELTVSPVRAIKLPSARGEKRLELANPAQLRALLEWCWENDRGLCGLLAIAFFTGMRMSMLAPPKRKLERGEFLRLDMIDRKKKRISIPGGIMKTGAPHIIETAPPCLWKWLSGLKKTDFGRKQSNFNRRKNVALKAVGMKWPANLHRRSFGSYGAAWKDAVWAADIMSDRTESIFIRHYKVAAFKEDADRYFS